MGWTLWKNRSKCQRCGAELAEGSSQCEYCSTLPPLELPAPQPPTKRGNLWKVALVLVVAMVVAFFSRDRVSRVDERALGGAAVPQLKGLIRRMSDDGFNLFERTRILAMKKGRGVAPLRLEAAFCYAFPVASGRQIRSIVLRNSENEQVKTRAPLRAHDVFIYCPPVDGTFRLAFVLSKPGLVSWALMYRTTYPDVERGRGARGDGGETARDEAERLDQLPGKKTIP